MVEYWIGDGRTFLWLLTQTGLHTFILPESKALDKLATDARPFIFRGSRRIYPHAAKALQRLSYTVLSPIYRLIPHKRILLVGYNALAAVGVPFAALTVPRRAGYHPLLTEHEIVCVPSAETLLAAIRHSPNAVPDTRPVAVFADPIFNASDPRLRAAPQPEPQPDPPALAAFRSAGFVTGKKIAVPRLPFSRIEAEDIKADAAGRRVLVFLGVNATRKAISSRRVAAARIIHIATHAVANDSDPDLSGLIFSLVDANGRPQAVFLPLRKIEKLRLSAKLVVLSACDTAAGRTIHGEGIIGLTSAFMKAGAGSVISSFWKVDDEATATLMGLFYQNLFHEKTWDPAAALRSAQLEMYANPRWRSPRFWAGFALHGTWR